MKRFVFAVVVFATSSFASIAAAQQPKDAKPGAAAPAKPAEPGHQMPTPPTEVAEAFKKMKGTWKCTGTAAMMGGAPVKGTMTFKLDPGKFFIVGTWKSQKTKTMPAMTSLDYRTYDPSSKKWISTGVDLSMGGWSQSTSTGPSGNKTVWDGKVGMIGMNGQQMTARTTEEEVSAKEIKLLAEMSQDGKKWTPAWEATCKK
jgi:hypothetical protein